MENLNNIGLWFMNLELPLWGVVLSALFGTAAVGALSRGVVKGAGWGGKQLFKGIRYPVVGLWNKARSTKAPKDWEAHYASLTKAKRSAETQETYKARCLELDPSLVATTEAQVADHDGKGSWRNDESGTVAERLNSHAALLQKLEAKLA